MTEQSWTSEQIKEFIEAILDEQRRGMIVAEQEREKAAKALRIELERAINQGDEALRDHISNQIAQLAAALVSADMLEQERIRTVTARLDTQFDAAQKAIAKADTATEKRFEGVNEWRAQSADRERTQAEQLALFTSEFIRLDVHKAEMGQLQRQIGELKERLGKIV